MKYYVLPRALLASFVLLSGGLFQVAKAAEPAVVSLITASDLANSSATLSVPTAGDYTVFAWTSGKDSWSVGFRNSTITLTSKSEGDDIKPGWRKLGKINLLAKAPAIIKVQESEPAKPDTSKTKEKAGGATKEAAAPKPVPYPVLLAISSDPEIKLGPIADIVRGRLDTTEAVDDPRRTTSLTRNGGNNFQPPVTREAWLDRAENVRNQMLVTLGLWPMFPKTDLQPKIYGLVDRDGYTIEKVVLETLPGFTLSGNLYRPKGKTGRLPVVLCPHGHWKDGRVNPEVQSRCIWWAKQLGCVVFMYDMVGYNDSKEFGHEFLNDRLQRWGLSLFTLQTWNSIRALDWAVTLPYVDPARVGCTGESGGGTQTFILTALDQRIKVAAPVVMVSHKMQGGCLCENCAGLRIATDNVEIAALTAPRPMKLVGANDWTDLTMSVEYPTLKKVYGLLGATDRISADKYEFEHNYNQTTRNAVYAFMGRWLVGIEDSASTKEGKVVPEAPEVLWTFDKDHPAPTDRRSPAQLETDLVQVMTRAIDALSPAGSPVGWEAAKRSLLTALDVRVRATQPAAFDLATSEIHRSNIDGVSIVHMNVARISTKDKVPVVRFTPKNATGRATILFTPRGKADLVIEGKLHPLVRALLDRGQSVIGFDPLFVGESIDPKTHATNRPKVDHIYTYNKSVAAEHAQDLATVLAWARTRPDIREINLVSNGQSGPIALITRPTLSGLARTAIDLNGFDFGDGSGSLPPALELPGVLQFGGLKAAAALVAPHPILITGAPAGFDTSWPLRAYALADASQFLKIGHHAPKAETLARWLDQGD
jgi:dienelactone hydrolase